jgi:EAL domain-containing protein (putative c-di-GMP-specific phosphodiesterase class I)
MTTHTASPAAGAAQNSDLQSGRGSVLLVDDEPLLLRAYTRILEKRGFEVQTASDGAAAAAMLAERRFGVILSDISMPGMNGLALLREVRKRDLDVPVLLMTGAPALDTAMEALDNGALRYLVKPIAQSKLLELLENAVRLHALAVAKREALELLGASGMLVGDRAGLEASFARALSSLWMAFQPIVRWPENVTFGYEALVRNEEPTLVRPDHLFDAAERLGSLELLGRRIRAAFVEAAQFAPEDSLLFLNLHPKDLGDATLFAADSPLSALAPRVVLEITERASLSQVKDVRGRVAELRKLGFRIALDDLGAGYAGLTSFAQLDPDVVKLDMSLVRGSDTEPTKQAILSTFVNLCRDLKMMVVAEGVETVQERDTLASLGCTIFQGYLFGRPARLAPSGEAAQRAPGGSAPSPEPT